MYLSDFLSLHPTYKIPQKDALNWIVSARKTIGNVSVEEIEQQVARVCCKEDKIAYRYTLIEDLTHQEWSEMALFNVCQHPEGLGLKERSQFYVRYVDEIFQKFYADVAVPPDDLIHVTCTGYVSPSGGQKLVSKRGWEKETTVTHVYHMGCYAAMPAIRIASGFAACGKEQIDVIHTELCSLHSNPALHTAEQFVAESLFSDGLIKYSLYREKKKPSLKILALYEEIIPESEEKMKWECENWGFKMTLAKEIPLLISKSILPFVQHLAKKGGISFSDIQKKGMFAIHPGGPKIIEQIKKKLDLSKEQICASEKILLNYGNMSSATLPHIWEEILREEHYPEGSVIVGLAFGPGLCMSGILLQKEV